MKKRNRGARNPSSTTNRHIPVELLPDILSRIIPLRSLLQWRCVSKTWKALINDPVFARLHFTRSNSILDETHLFVVQETRGRQECVIRSIKTLATVANLTLPPIQAATAPKGQRQCAVRSTTNEEEEEGFGEWQCKCFVDGLAMLVKSGKSFGMTLWNPSIRKARRLPDIAVGNKAMHFGFGFDTVSQDYKHVVSMPRSYAVYSLGSNSWKRAEYKDKKIAALAQLESYNKMAFCFKGVLYHQNGGVLFDLSTETFSPVSYPEPKNIILCSKMTPFDCGRSLSMVNCTPFHVFVWVLGEGGVWAQRYFFRVFDPKCGVHDLRRLQLVYMTMSGLLLLNLTKIVASYSPETGHLATLLEDDDLDINYAHPYKESLILLN